MFYAEDQRIMGEYIKTYKRRLPLDAFEQLTLSSKGKVVNNQ